MQLETRVVNDVLVARIGEERLDARIAVSFKQELLAWVTSFEQLQTSRNKDREITRRIVVDLTEVAFIDSSGIGALVSVMKALGRRGDLALCGVRETVMTAFRITRMDRVFRFFSSESEALENL